MQLRTLVPWYGSDRQVARKYARRFDGVPWVGILYAGGMSMAAELVDATTIVANDLHADVINLAEVVADDRACETLIARLETTPYHRRAFENAQLFISNDRIDSGWDYEPSEPARVERAALYFLAAWGGRNGEAGTLGESSTSFSVRFDAGGGDSAVRFRAAIADLRAWQRQFDRVTFECRDALDLLESFVDDEACGIYCDPPWPRGGSRYRHSFDDEHFASLEAKLRIFERARIVVRSSNCRVTRERFDPSFWTVEEVVSRSQANKPVAELLITPNHQSEVGPLFTCGQSEALDGR